MLEKQAYIKTCDYNTYESYGVPNTSYYPGVGIAGAKMARDELTYNSCDIESDLFGIGSTNLEKRQMKLIPSIKTKQSLNFANRVPLYMPKPLEVDTTIQRPLYLS